MDHQPTTISFARRLSWALLNLELTAQPSKLAGQEGAFKQREFAGGEGGKRKLNHGDTQDAARAPAQDPIPLNLELTTQPQQIRTHSGRGQAHTQLC
jgi:hypothetical protein